MNFINDSILLFINVLHLIVILFIVCAPFSNSNYLLSMHAIVIPFIILHWILNNNTCSLTVAEKYIREQTYGVAPTDDECFAYKFISPIYDFNKNYEAYSYFTYSTTIILWLITMYNLNGKISSGEIKNFIDIGKI